MIPKETPWYDSPVMHIFEKMAQRLLSRDIDPIVAAYCGAVLDVAREYRIAAMGNGAAKIPDRPPPIRADPQWQAEETWKARAIKLEETLKAHERDYAAGNWKRVAEDRLARIEALEKDMEDLRIRNGGGVPS
jgi:hypothetical protein